MSDKRSIKHRHVFRELAFKLQTAKGDFADEIFKEMMDIMDIEIDEEEKANMLKTLSSNVRYSKQGCIGVSLNGYK